MRPRTEIPAAQVAAIHRAMLAAPGKSAFQRLQCLWLRARQDQSTEAIAQAVGLSVSHVRRVWSEYLRGGLAAGQGRPKGGRRHQNLTLTQERQYWLLGKSKPSGEDWSRPAASKLTMRNAWGGRCPIRRCVACWPGTSGGGSLRAPSIQRQPGGPCRF